MAGFSVFFCKITYLVAVISVLRKSIDQCGIHICRSVLVRERKLTGTFVQRSSHLQRKGVRGYMRGGKAYKSIYRKGEALLGLLGNAVHQICADIIKSRKRGIGISSYEAVGGMYPSKDAELVIVKGLCAHAEAVEACGTQVFKIIKVRGSGVTFSCYLCFGIYIEVLENRVKDSNKRARRKHCWCASAEINGINCTISQIGGGGMKILYYCICI